MNKPIVRAILDGAPEIAVPAFVSTLCICIVFVPVVFITGAAKSLFVPLAMAVVFAMLTSYFLSRTLVPTLVRYLLASGGRARTTAARAPPTGFAARFFAALRARLRAAARAPTARWLALRARAPRRSSSAASRVFVARVARALPARRAATSSRASTPA